MYGNEDKKNSAQLNGHCKVLKSYFQMWISVDNPKILRRTGKICGGVF